ncbi:hypothetical protein J42TS3_09690 [Paenibacillus vini]|uniref:Uncharacterized protein n=1 Tax=Paenibacillus vini TaxID=1476024 RepID=A0ABQ4M7G2_9BACL|nr:hypothetical protein J42TS3_09690 [Paenibacillus vini]
MADSRPYSIFAQQQLLGDDDPTKLAREERHGEIGLTHVPVTDWKGVDSKGTQPNPWLINTNFRKAG